MGSRMKAHCTAECQPGSVLPELVPAVGATRHRRLNTARRLPGSWMVGWLGLFGFTQGTRLSGRRGQEVRAPRNVQPDQEDQRGQEVR